jgi:hypothetical protein
MTHGNGIGSVIGLPRRLRLRFRFTFSLLTKDLGADLQTLVPDGILERSIIALLAVWQILCPGQQHVESLEENNV